MHKDWFSNAILIQVYLLVSTIADTLFQQDTRAECLNFLSFVVHCNLSRQRLDLSHIADNVQTLIAFHWSPFRYHLIVFLHDYFFDSHDLSPQSHVRHPKSCTKFPVGLTIHIKENDCLVCQGEFGVNDLLYPGQSLILFIHDVRIVGIILSDLPEFGNNLSFSLHSSILCKCSKCHPL